MIRLDPMTEAEYDAFMAWSRPRYAENKVRTGAWTPEEAAQRSEADHARLLPQGLRTPGHFLYIVRNAAGQAVGEVWYGLEQRDRPSLFIYWIGIGEEHRRHGYASEVLRRLEEDAKTHGVDAVVLHVFGDNTVAQAVYAKAGFEVSDLQMVRWLPGRGPPGRAR